MIEHAGLQERHGFADLEDMCVFLHQRAVFAARPMGDGQRATSGCLCSTSDDIVIVVTVFLELLRIDVVLPGRRIAAKKKGEM